MDESVFKSVWYRWTPRRGLAIWAWQDVGTLTVCKDYLEYCGRKKSLRIPVANISEIAIQKQGNDWVNRWVKVKYDNEKIAYVADGKLFGWHGLFGGTNNLLDVLASLTISK